MGLSFFFLQEDKKKITSLILASIWFSPCWGPNPFLPFKLHKNNPKASIKKFSRVKLPTNSLVWGNQLTIYVYIKVWVDKSLYELCKWQGTRDHVKPIAHSQTMSSQLTFYINLIFFLIYKIRYKVFEMRFGFHRPASTTFTHILNRKPDTS